MTIDELVRVSLIREQVNRRLVATNEEANEMVLTLLSKLSDVHEDILAESLEGWFSEQNIPLNLNLLPCLDLSKRKS